MSGMSARDVAFLQEMGIGPLWTLRDAPAAEPVPDAAPAEAPVPVQAARKEEVVEAARGEQAAPSAAPAVADGAPTDEQIGRMNWDELRAAVANCTRCGACKEGRKPVFGTGATQATWFVAAGASTAADEQAGAPLSGDTGKLLDNMLFALDLARERDVYVTNLVKCHPVSSRGGDRAPTQEEANACRPYLERELALTSAGTVLTLGQIAANGLLGKPLSEPLGGLRGAVHELRGVPLVATLHPGELLRRGADKALAWADLCRARAARARSG